MTTVYGGVQGAGYGVGNNVTGATENKKKDMLDKHDFLKLFIAQLSNQDPLSPLDNGEMLAQFAQFSLVEQITNMSASMDGLKTTLTDLYSQSIFTQGAALIGKDVTGNDGLGTIINGTVTGVKWQQNQLMLKVKDEWLNISQVVEVKKSTE